MTEQTRANGSLRHLLTLEGLTKAQLEALLTRAQKFVKPVGELPVQTRSLDGITVANMFTEPSTRTRVSFELAAKRLGADVVNLEVQLSSRVKGESMLDTIYTLEACHVDVFVIRDAEAGVPGLVASHVKPHVSVLSAGEAAGLLRFDRAEDYAAFTANAPRLNYQVCFCSLLKACEVATFSISQTSHIPAAPACRPR